MSRRRFTSQKALIVAAAALLLLASGIAVALETSAHRRALEDAYRASNETLVLTFSRAARTALVRGESEFLASAARMLIAGGAKAVQIVVGQDVVLSESAAEWTGEFALLDVGSDLDPDAAFATVEGSRLLDVVRPLYSSEAEPVPVGYVRVLFGTEIVFRQVRAHVLAMSGIATAASGALLAVLWLGLSRTRAKGASPAGDWLECGGLAISRPRKLVRVFDTEIGLTPKQFELLALLAAEPGRVFSDAELLEAVWPASPYANSSDVKQCVYVLRKRLAEVVADPHVLIETVTGHGIRLVPPGDEQRLKPI